MEESKIALLFKQLILLIIKKSRLRKVIILAEGKAKEQGHYLFKQLNLEIVEASNPNTSVVLSRLLEDF